MSGIVMSRNLSDEVVRSMLIAKLGLEKVKQLAPTDPQRDFAPAAGLDLQGIDRRILKNYLAASKMWQFRPSSKAEPESEPEPEPSPWESNNWVVAGDAFALGPSAISQRSPSRHRPALFALPRASQRSRLERHRQR